MTLHHHVYLVLSWCVQNMKGVVCHLASDYPLGQQFYVCANEKSILVFFYYDRGKGYIAIS